MKKIFLIVGKSCVGKDTISKKVSNKLKVPIAKSVTTRPKREGEKQSVEYYFISNNKFNTLKKNNMLAEHTSYKVYNEDVWYYGITKEELEQSKYVIAIVNPESAKQIKKIYEERVVIIEIISKDKDRIKRYLDREEEDNISECFRRYLADEKDFENFKSDYIVVNDELRKSTTKLMDIMKREMAKELLEDTKKEFKLNPFKFLGGCK